MTSGSALSRRPLPFRSCLRRPRPGPRFLRPCPRRPRPGPFPHPSLLMLPVQSLKKSLRLPSSRYLLPDRRWQLLRPRCQRMKLLDLPLDRKMTLLLPVYLRQADPQICKLRRTTAMLPRVYPHKPRHKVNQRQFQLNWRIHPLVLAKQVKKQRAARALIRNARGAMIHLMET